MNVAERLKLYSTPTGRRIFCHRQIIQVAREHAVVPVLAHAEAALAHDQKTLQLELRYQATPEPAQFSPMAMQLDGKLDRAITGMDSFLDAQIRLYGEDSARGGAAATVRQAIFPEGVAAITRLPYVQEDAAVSAILTRLEHVDLAEPLSRIPGIRDTIDQLRLHHQAYHEALVKEIDQGPTMDEVRAMQNKGQELLARTMALILAHYVTTENAQVARALMAPIERQQEALGDLWRRRRRPRDVDPETGTEIDKVDP